MKLISPGSRVKFFTVGPVIGQDHNPMKTKFQSVHASLFGYIQEFEFVTASPSRIVGALCRLSISTRIRYDIKRSVTNQKRRYYAIHNSDQRVTLEDRFSTSLFPVLF